MENFFWHSLQWYGFSPEWVLWCFFRLPGPGNIVGHCRKWWFLRLQTSKNVFGHSLQEYGSSPEWILWWFHRLPAYENVLKHFLQWMNESSDVLLEKMSLGVLYKNMVSQAPWISSLVYLQKTSWEYLLRFTMSLRIIVYCSTLEVD